MEEIWKPVVGYEGIYEVSNNGNVLSLKYGRTKVLKPCINTFGYLMVGLLKEGKQKNCKVHRLVALAFLKNPENKPQVNHIDGNKRNNSLSNLEFCTNSENIKHAYATGLSKITENHNFKTNHPSRGKFGLDNNSSKTVNQIDIISGEIIRAWGGDREVERELGISQSSISRCCNGKQKSAGGFRWEIAPPITNKL